MLCFKSACFNIDKASLYRILILGVMKCFGKSDKNGHRGITNFGTVTGLDQGILNYVGILIVAYENIFISLTGSDGISACLVLIGGNILFGIYGDKTVPGLGFLYRRYFWFDLDSSR